MGYTDYTVSYTLKYMDKRPDFTSTVRVWAHGDKEAEREARRVLERLNRDATVVINYAWPTPTGMP